MSENVDYTIELKEVQYEYLKEMTEKYGLPDVSKTLRCLINYAREESQTEESIFEEIRCLHC